jgi:hypothetical protein
MAGKQAKILTGDALDFLLATLLLLAIRSDTMIVVLSVKAGLCAGEIAD